MDEKKEIEIKSKIKYLLKTRINFVGTPEKIDEDLYGLTNDLFELVIHSLPFDKEN